MCNLKKEYVFGMLLMKMNPQRLKRIYSIWHLHRPVKTKGSVLLQWFSQTVNTLLLLSAFTTWTRHFMCCHSYREIWSLASCSEKRLERKYIHGIWQKFHKRGCISYWILVNRKRSKHVRIVLCRCLSRSQMVVGSCRCESTALIDRNKFCCRTTTSLLPRLGKKIL